MSYQCVQTLPVTSKVQYMSDLVRKSRDKQEDMEMFIPEVRTLNVMVLIYIICALLETSRDRAPYT